MLWALLLSVAAVQEAPRRAAVLGYYPSWASKLPPKDIRYERFTHLAHAFLQAEPDGRLKADPAIPSADFARRAREKRVVPLLSLGGANSGDTFFSITQNADTLRRYVDAVAAAAREHGYGGFDLDWEFPQDVEGRDGLSRLVAALRKASPAAFLSVAVSATDWYGRWWDVDALRPHVDQLNVMAYDFHGSWSAHAGHPAPLRPAAGDDEACGTSHAVVAAADYWIEKRKWPAQRLSIGIPAYGVGFAVRQWHQKPAGKPSVGAASYRELRRLAEGTDWVRAWNADVGVPTLVRRDGAELIGYEDPESAALKGAWARARGVGGIFFWQIEQDWIDGDHHLVRAASEAFLKVDVDAARKRPLGADGTERR
jgi:chitinase